MGFLYAATDDQGLLNKIVDFIDELTWDQKLEIGVKDFVDEDLPSDFDSTTQKVGDMEIIETRELIIRRKIIILKDAEDLFQDQMVARQVNLPNPEISIVVMARIIRRMARVMMLQVDPADPNTHLDILQHDRALLRKILDVADDTPMQDPSNPDLPPGGDAPDSTQTPSI